MGLPATTARRRRGYDDRRRSNRARWRGWRTGPRCGPRTGAAEVRVIEGHHDPHASRISPQERNPLQRRRDADRILGFDERAQRRTVARDHLAPRRSEVPDRAVCDEPQLQERARWVEVGPFGVLVAMVKT